MNYEVKSAKEANINEIFYDKNTNKLSYKNELGVIKSLDSSNNYSTAILDVYPFVKLPVLISSNTQVKQTAIGTSLAYGKTLEEYKITGSFVLDNEPSSDFIYLGTLEDLNILIPEKLTGIIEVYDPNSNSYINMPLAYNALALDEGTAELTKLTDVTIALDYFVGGADLYFSYNASPADLISMFISFEYTFLTTGSIPKFIFY